MKLKEKLARFKNFFKKDPEKVEEKKVYTEHESDKIVKGLGYVPMSEDQFRQWCKTNKYKPRDIERLVREAKEERGGFRKREARESVAQRAISLVLNV